ncbi:hypothetical protein Rsub_01147 [Raphidocelis subcapitata]|uniref:Cytochrome b561 domain-containing protein n=1 Tax=Raphidocelis subcapitata TaxID=307507 RepID=A0A2V0NUD3_9CHLO|nr:hypothetical protein Rsub_01147 [Raphidocelis subcapitata]|eukprot:GBF88435.1 hypothetical protein Rsub_01147 [Raphidocelis subcapitata]
MAGPHQRGASAAPGASAAAAARALAVALLALVGWWVHARLGGVSARADRTADGGVSTARLFNWHPVLMTLAFPVLMGEALLAYRSPWLPDAPRPLRKLAHGAFHSLAAVCVAAGLSAVWRSHDEASPPVPNLYSPHSFVGLAAVCLFGLQFAIGAGFYAWPGAPLHRRQALGPVHRFLGRAVFVCGLAAAAMGLQEKATFLQAFGKKDVRSPDIAAPAWAALLLLPLGAAVLGAQAAPDDGAPGGVARPPSGQHLPLPADDGGSAAELGYAAAAR